MKRRKYLNRFAVFFSAFMLFFTLFSGSIHRQTMPEVVVLRVREREFPVTIDLEDGAKFITAKRELGVPESALDFFGMDGGKTARAFVLEETEGGFIVCERFVQLGEKADGWYEVEDGLGKRDQVVCAADRELADGVKVRVRGEWGHVR